ncbi:hypothetical protein ACJJTC_003070 [Scirpophaga incertulas]
MNVLIVLFYNGGDSSVVGSRHRRVPGHNAPQRATMARALSAGCAQSETEARPPETIADHTSKELQVTIVRTLRGRLNTCQETGSGTLCSWKYHFLYHGTTFKTGPSLRLLSRAFISGEQLVPIQWLAARAVYHLAVTVRNRSGAAARACLL